MRGALLVAAGLALLWACSDSYLFDERRQSEVAADRSVSLEGRFCTLSSSEVQRPIKIFFAFDASQSMNVTDPDGTRARALVELIEALPRDPDIYISLMLFAGKTTAFLTNNNTPGYQQITTLDGLAKLKLVDQLLNFTNPDNSPNRDSTDFVKPLSEIFSVISADISATQTAAQASKVLGLGRYSVIFLSDGHPTQNQDDQLIYGDSVRRIRQLADMAEDVRFNTVHVFNPVQPVGTACDFTNPDAGVGCPLLLVNQDADRLDQMARLGGGEFRDFRNNEPINFLNFRFGQTRRTFEVKDVVLSNLSAPVGSPQDQADSDGDGLTDSDEQAAGTALHRTDTDGDGFSDAVEVRFAQTGASFTANQVALPDGGGLDPGCPPTLRGLDADCDGLTDCDEQLIGTSGVRADSDSDGVPDGVEWRQYAQPAGADLDEDSDNDGVTTRQELRLHGDPRVVDSASLSQSGYRYTIESEGSIDAEGRQCYRLRVENILLAPTAAEWPDAGVGRTLPPDAPPLEGPGYNQLYVSVAQVPTDNPNGRTVVRAIKIDGLRFPVAGIRSPTDGRVHVAPEEFGDGCAVRSSPFSTVSP